MSGYRFQNKLGDFILEHPEHYSGLYFPIANEAGYKASVTPNLGGDAKYDQNSFLLQPVSILDLHNNKSSRNFWCYINNETLWSATGASADAAARLMTKQEDEVMLEAGILWHKITRSNRENNIKAEVLTFSPECKYKIEIMRVMLTNTGENVMGIEPVAAIPIYGRSADNIRDHRHVTSLLNRVRTTKESVILKPTFTFDERGHKLNTLSYFVSGTEGNGSIPAGFYTDTDDFVGEGGSLEQPLGLLRDLRKGTKNYCTEGYSAEGGEILGGIRFGKCCLKPGETKSYIIVMGISEAPDDIIYEYNTDEKVDEAYRETVESVNKRLNISFHTSDENFDTYMRWVEYQPELRRIYGCSFLPHHDYGRGGRGWRDLWQDCLALLLMNPQQVSELLLSNYAGVRTDGTNATIIGNNPGEFKADRNNIVRVWMDHAFWPYMTTKLYLDQTGDISFLFREAPYFRDSHVMRGTETFEGDVCETGSVLEHIFVENLTAVFDVGTHDICRLHGADWNDALDMAAENGESTAFTFAYMGNLRSIAKILTEHAEFSKVHSEISLAEELEILLTACEDADVLGGEVTRKIEKKQSALEDYCRAAAKGFSGKKKMYPAAHIGEIMNRLADSIEKHLNKSEWLENEGFYNGYYDNDGFPVEGSKEKKVSSMQDINDREDVRMMLTGQVFAIMSGAAPDENINRITSAADRYLYDENIGGYRLNTNFHELKTNLGRMFGFAYGHKENGAVFSHMAVMYANALYKRNHVKEGYKVLKTLYGQCLNFEKSKIYPGIPEYFDNRGRGLYHYLTGAASWFLMTVVNEMFGVKGQDGRLCLNPKLVSEQFDEDGTAVIECIFNRKPLKIIYRNEKHLETGEYKVRVIDFLGEKYLCDENGKIPENLQEKLVTDNINVIICNLINAN